MLPIIAIDARWFATVAAFVTVAACWEPREPGDSTDAGGAGDGGAIASSGGVVGGGGAPASGGTVNSGGVPAPGGTPSSGGTPVVDDAGASDAESTGGAASEGDATASGGAPGTPDGGSASGGTSSLVGPVCTDPSAPRTCGNGIVEPSEFCDGDDLRGATCFDISPIFDGGTLGCTESCAYDTGRCVVNGTCGNGVVDPGEECEPAEFYAGQLQFCRDYLPDANDALVECSITTCKYDFGNCGGRPAPVCGNGIRESGEQCDGVDWMRRTCQEAQFEYTWGVLGCNQATCQFDLSQCERCDGTRCGDGVVQPSYETCDGTPTKTCADVNRLFGTVTCSPRCQDDTSGCTGGCTFTPWGVFCN